MSDNLATLAEDSLQRLGERRNLWFEGEWTTNAQTQDRARRVHGALMDMGGGKGTISALCMGNHPLIYPCFQGIFRTGGAAVPVMFQLPAAELRYVLEDTQARFVFTDQENLEKVREAVGGLDLRPGETYGREGLLSEVRGMGSARLSRVRSGARPRRESGTTATSFEHLSHAANRHLPARVDAAKVGE